MKTLLSAVLVLSFVTVCNAQELQTITFASGVVNFAATDIVQIVGVASNYSDSTGSTGRLILTFGDGASVTNNLNTYAIATGSGGNRYAGSNRLQGSSFTNLTSLEVKGAGAVTVKKMNQASELVSDPVMLPLLDDSVFAISIETSVDLINWAPAAPGDYLGDTSHRYFRIKAVQQPTP